MVWRRSPVSRSIAATRPEAPSEMNTSCSPENTMPCETPRHSPSSKPPAKGGEAVQWRPCHSAPCSSTVIDAMPGPRFAEATLVPEGLTANANGPGPVRCCSPEGAITRPPGRMAESRPREGGRIPAGGAYVCGEAGRCNKTSAHTRRRAADTSSSYNRKSRFPNDCETASPYGAYARLSQNSLCASPYSTAGSTAYALRAASYQTGKLLEAW